LSNGPFKLFNPSSSGPFEIWRLSNRHYCSNRFIPILIPSLQNFSVLQSSQKILDTSYFFGPGQYEDPRILQISKDKAALVFVRHNDVGSICVALINESYDILGSIEYVSEQTQKNWMPRLVQGNLLLYARVPDVVYTIPAFEKLRHHEKIHVDPIKCGEWRGSSQVIFIEGFGNFGILHRRLRPDIRTFFLPKYSYAFYNFDTLQLCREFDIVYHSFVYVNSIEAIGGGLRVSCGISDCVKKSFDISKDVLQNLTRTGSRLKFHIS
jgi:hypothetical protein